MSTSSFTPVISQELQATVRNNPKIKKVYFDADNRHYFNVFKLREDKGDKRAEKEWDFFGSGLFSHQEEIPGLFNVDKKKESISKGDPLTRIVAILERKDILTAQPTGSLQAMTIEQQSPIDVEAIQSKIYETIMKGIQDGSIVVPTPAAAPAVVQPAASGTQDEEEKVA